MKLITVLLFFSLLFGGAIRSEAANIETVKKEVGMIKAPAPYGAIPNERHLYWRKNHQYYGLICFGLNTYTGQEWGDGTVSTKVFKPTELDARQWARVAKAAGMDGLILVAKHHDGFCLWPSEYTEYDLASTSWKNGNGDIVKDLAEACKEFDIGYGLYTSPWDRNHPKYGESETYNNYFKLQIDELMNKCEGQNIFEWWFDGAGTNRPGPTGKYQVFDYSGFNDRIHQHRKNTIIFHGGDPDLRWVGNERGYAGETMWSPFIEKRWGVGSAEKPKEFNKGHENGDRWIPAESDVPLRRGWYWHDNENPKPLKQLIDIYFASVGRNSSLNFGLAPDKRGLLADEDVDRLKELGDYIRATFKKDFSLNCNAVSNQTRGQGKQFAASNVTDGNYDTYWATDDGVLKGSIEIDLVKSTQFNVVEVQEYIPLGQRVKAWRVEAYHNGNWKEIGKATTIGYKRLLRVPTTIATKIRIQIMDSLACPTLSTVGIYRTPVMLENPLVKRDNNGMLEIQSVHGTSSWYAIGEKAVGKDYKQYKQPIPFTEGGTIHFYSKSNANGQKTEVITKTYGMAKAKWKIVGCSFPNEGNANVQGLIDNNPNSMWHTHGKKEGRLAPPQWVSIDLGETIELKGFTYMPRHDGTHTGLVDRYSFYTSLDGKEWGQPVAKGDFSNIQNNPVEQSVEFGKTVSARFVKFVAEHAVAGNNCVAICEIGLIPFTDK